MRNEASYRIVKLPMAEDVTAGDGMRPACVTVPRVAVQADIAG